LLYAIALIMIRLRVVKHSVRYGPAVLGAVPFTRVTAPVPETPDLCAGNINSDNRLLSQDGQVNTVHYGSTSIQLDRPTVRR